MDIINTGLNKSNLLNILYNTMPDPITRIIFRRGTELEREGLLLNQGEPGFAIDSRRLYIGDGQTLGGISVGTKFLGFYGFGAIGSNIPFNLAPLINDLAYDTTTNILYALTAANFSLKASWAPVGINIQADNTTLQKTVDTLSVKPGSLDFNYIKTSAIGRGLETVDGPTGRDTLRISTPGQGLEFNGNALQIKNNNVTNTMLSFMPSQTVKGNILPTAGLAADVSLTDLANVLAPILKPIINPTYQPGVDAPRYDYTNGIVINDLITPPVWSVDPSFISFNVDHVLIKKTIRCLGDVVAYFTPSDKSIKSNIVPLDKALDKISKITGYTFTFNKRAPEHLIKKTSYGLIAQEVEQVLPHAVEIRPDGVKGINYEATIALLVESIKELRAEIAALKKK